MVAVGSRVGVEAEGTGAREEGDGRTRSGLLPSQVRRQVLLFTCVVFLLGMSGGLFEPTFNNYLKDTFHLTAGQRGKLEFPREFPGFLTAVLFGWLFFLVEARMAVVAVLAAAAILAVMHAKPRSRKRAAFVFRREYTLFYILSTLFGARKQVFITFGAWVLVNVFRQEPASFAKLLIASAVIGMVLKPALGRWIDRFGERPVLVADSALMVLVCLGYGFAERLGLGRHAITLVFACYMLDQILFATGMARATYLDKIALRPEEVSPTLSLGVSIDHAVSMTIPVLGGWVWNHWGYPYVFVGAACIAMVNGFAALQIRIPEKQNVLAA